MQNGIKISSYCLGLENANRCKYGAAIFVARMLNEAQKRTDMNIDWKFVQEILTDIGEYGLYRTEEEYIHAVINKYMELQINFIISSEYKKLFNDLSKEYVNYIITPDEVEFFKSVFVTFITGLVNSFSIRRDNPIITIIPDAEYVKTIYHGDAETVCKKMLMSANAFFGYNKCDIKKVLTGHDNNGNFVLSFHV